MILIHTNIIYKIGAPKKDKCIYCINYFSKCKIMLCLSQSSICYTKGLLHTEEVYITGYDKSKHL